MQEYITRVFRLRLRYGRHFQPVLQMIAIFKEHPSQKMYFCKNE